MKRLLPLTLLFLAPTYACYTSAEDSWYAGALYNMQEVSIRGRDFNTAGVVAGYQYSQYFSLETRLLTGTSGYSSFYGTREEPRGNYTEDIDKQASLLLKASYPVFSSLNLYVLTGYTYSDYEISGLGQTNDSEGNITGDFPFNITRSESGISYGVGLDYQLNENFRVFIDYQALPDFEPGSNVSNSWKSTTIGVSYLF
ncbi:MAG: porin family protein [Alteromonadaceae bacterium]|nr:porin family protein [Alteromonadaceae bacterium]